MKTKTILIGLLAIIISSCSSRRYLPSKNKVDVNQNGSYIKIICKTTPNIDGELIAIDSNTIVVLTATTNNCIAVDINDIKRFKLRYAKPQYRGLIIPIYTLAAMAHGLGAAITVPISLIVTVSVAATGKSAFTYNNKNMTYEKLKMYARFPQGIPPAIDIATIK